MEDHSGAPLDLDFARCRKVWIPDEERWSSPPKHVEIGVREIINHPYFLLADTMGGMKTAQTLIAAQFMHEANIIDRVIVVAPASVRPKVWFDQDLGQIFEQAFDDKRIVVSEFHQKIKQWTRGPKDARELRFIITNYEFIRTGNHLVTLLPYCGPKTLLVLDESSAVRNYDSIQTEACMILRWRTNKKGRPMRGYPRCGRILLLNGTPIAESPEDMFSQGNLMHPSVLDCRYITHYRARYAVQTPVLGHGGKPIESPYSTRVRQPDGSIKMVPQHIKKIEQWTNLEDLQQRFAPYILRREAKELGIDFALPPVGLDVPLTEKTWKMYRQMRDDMVIWLESGVATSATAAVRSIRLAQILSGFVGGIESTFLDDEKPVGPIQEIGREKIDFAIGFHAEMLKRYQNLKLLTWCRFVPELRRYLKEERLTFPSIPISAACGQKVMDGEQSKNDEREMALRLLHPKTAPAGPATVGATQGTGALGLNFTACRTVLDMSYDFSPWKKKQGDSRVNRPGQTGLVSFFYLVATGPQGQKTFDHHVMMTRLGKMSVNDWTVAGWVRALTDE